MSLAKELLQKAYKEYQEQIGNGDIGVIARRCGLPYTSVYGPLLRDRNPNADIWLKIMEGLGAAKENKNHIRIKK